MDFNLMRPKSRGSVRLVSNYPIEDPEIDLNYLSTDYEVDLAIQVVHGARDSTMYAMAEKLLI